MNPLDVVGAAAYVPVAAVLLVSEVCDAGSPSYTAGKFAIEVNGSAAGFVISAEGGSRLLRRRRAAGRHPGP